MTDQVTGRVGTHPFFAGLEEEFRKLGGNTDLSTPDGYKRFNELLDTIWAARWLLLK